MTAAPGELRERLRERLGEAGLRARMAGLEAETGGLFSEEAVLAVLADEEGLLEDRVGTLSALRPGDPVFVECRVDLIEPLREFRTRDGVGKLRKLRVSDGSGSSTLTLWDEETELVERLGLAPGTRVRVLSAEMKRTPYGDEIRVGRSGFLVLMKEGETDEPSVPTDIHDLEKRSGRVDVKGVMLELRTTGRGRSRTASGRLFDGTGECAVVFSKGALEKLGEAGAGAEVELRGGRVDRSEGRVLIFCDDLTRVVPL